MFNKIKILLLSESFLNLTQQSRCLARWFNRKPVNVISSEEYDEETDTRITQKSSKNTAWNENYFANKSNEKKEPKDVKPLTISKRMPVSKVIVDMLETTIDQNGNFIYTKMNNNDVRITKILTEIKSNKERDKKDLILLEGKRLIKDALDAKCKLEYLLFSRFDEVEFLRPSILKLGAKLYKMPYREIQMWSDLVTSPGVMGIFKTPNLELYKPKQDALPLTLICDNIREADNLGAILRTSSGVGCEQVLLTKGCVNVWDSKVLRSACGAHFKLKILKKCDLETIQDNLPTEYNIFIADNKIVSLSTVEKSSDKQVLSELVRSIPLLPYYGVAFDPNKHNVLIVGGETEGISEQSYKLASELKGVRLNIPLGNNVDSLNVGTALGIIVFEMKRQFLIATSQASV
ncbi:rRNA methyltransferase 3, mitochondrial [Diorhabda carinulata]|uniref:rRNA methyltransferase 3, mitochondrial n=1 Tax=Diorhabda carinulata TaxID=1163345 RepID=UPI0025A1FABC|nr:rRNA methyltransferase 3, mitochondrial [Diorhabda carinulata]